MHSHSSLARLLRLVLAVQIALAGAWFAMHWPASRWLALGGVVAILFFYSAIFALEFLLLARLAREDPAPRATARQMLRAWWRETLEVPLVFGWRQPLGWRAVPDHLPRDATGRRGAVFIHGFICNRGFWTPWLTLLRERDTAFVAVNLEPVFASIDDYAPIIDAAVRRVAESTGLPPVLVCHSMGGLAARAWLRAAGERANVHCVVTIGSPHHGTSLARLSHFRNGRQMRRGSDWLRQLAQDEQARPQPRFLCWFSHCDNIVMPPSTAAMAGADNRHVEGAAHVDLALHPDVIRVSLEQVWS